MRILSLISFDFAFALRLVLAASQFEADSGRRKLSWPGTPRLLSSVVSMFIESSFVAPNPPHLLHSLPPTTHRIHALAFQPSALLAGRGPSPRRPGNLNIETPGLGRFCPPRQDATSDWPLFAGGGGRGGGIGGGIRQRLFWWWEDDESIFIVQLIFAVTLIVAFIYLVWRAWRKQKYIAEDGIQFAWSLSVVSAESSQPYLSLHAECDVQH